MLDVLTTIRELTFRAAVSLSNATTPIQRIAADETVVLAVYRSNYAYLAGALAVMIACLLGTLPLFDGFWRLGRQVSLSPIEIARAFQAPVLADVHSNRPVHELLREVGNRRVRYGMLPVQIWDESRGEYIQGTSLAMADPAFISVPPTKA